MSQITLNKRIDAFVEIGNILANTSSWPDKLKDAINKAQVNNQWFTLDNIHFAIASWAAVLTHENLEKWTSAYDFSNVQPKTIGIVTAGNIPLVGMHDFISVLLSGHKILIKQSSNDSQLLPVISDFLQSLQPEFKNFISFTDGKLTGFDAIIATGSNNTARYFESYFGKYPHIIRKNRNAVAVLTGNESRSELTLLGDDIFRYFGLGCRSVSKLFIPKNYDLDKIFRAIYPQNAIIQHHKYKNNYDYNKALYLMGSISLVENGFVLLKEDTGYASPIAVLYYEYYDDLEALKNRIDIEKEQIQCIVSQNIVKDSVNFGQTQIPQLWEYADGVDTLAFLLNL